MKKAKRGHLRIRRKTKQKKNEKDSSKELMMVGGIMTLVGAAFYITGWFLSPYIYIIGAGLFAIAQINTIKERIK